MRRGLFKANDGALIRAGDDGRNLGEDVGLLGAALEDDWGVCAPNDENAKLTRVGESIWFCGVADAEGLLPIRLCD